MMRIGAAAELIIRMPKKSWTPSSAQVALSSAVVTLGLEANNRFAPPGPLVNNGSGTYTVTAGQQWDFNYYANITGGNIPGLSVKLFYDLDPAANTPLASLGHYMLTSGLTGGTKVQDSEYPGFSFLNGFPGVTPPAGAPFAFDPNALGEYTFALGLVNSDGVIQGNLDLINVDVVAGSNAGHVPDGGSTAAMLGCGFFGLFAAKRQMKKRS